MVRVLLVEAIVKPQCRQPKEHRRYVHHRNLHRRRRLVIVVVPVNIQGGSPPQHMVRGVRHYELARIVGVLLMYY